MGFVVGPFTDHRWVDPDPLIGDLLMPLVSLSVGLIMFEGGLTLKFRELDAIGSVVIRLISVGALMTWGLSLLLARFALGWDWPLCALVGAILVVTGPTVILPLLRFLQPTRQVASALKWEGIMIDPVGALLALLVFETIHHGLGEHGAQWTQFPTYAFMGFFWTLVIGGVAGCLGAGLIYYFFKHHWVHEHQQTPFALMVAVSAFTLSNHFQHESGLLATTLMGVILANQKQVDVRHVLEFKENLVVLMISTLFIVLSARLELATFSALPVLGHVGLSPGAAGHRAAPDRVGFLPGLFTESFGKTLLIVDGATRDRGGCRGLGVFDATGGCRHGRGGPAHTGCLHGDCGDGSGLRPDGWAGCALAGSFQPGPAGGLDRRGSRFGAQHGQGASGSRLSRLAGR